MTEYEPFTAAELAELDQLRKLAVLHVEKILTVLPRLIASARRDATHAELTAERDELSVKASDLELQRNDYIEQNTRLRAAVERLPTESRVNKAKALIDEILSKFQQADGILGHYLCSASAAHVTMTKWRAQREELDK